MPQVKETLVKEAQVKEARVKEARVKEARVKEAQVKEAQVKGTHLQRHVHTVQVYVTSTSVLTLMESQVLCGLARGSWPHQINTCACSLVCLAKDLQSGRSLSVQGVQISLQFVLLAGY